MVDIADRQEKAAAKEETAERKPLPRWMITVASVTILLIVWEIFGRRINPVFGSYPSAIAEAFWELVVTGQLWSALYDSLRPFVIGYALAILIGVPLGLFIGGFRAAEAALGLYITAGYAMSTCRATICCIVRLPDGTANSSNLTPCFSSRPERSK